MEIAAATVADSATTAWALHVDDDDDTPRSKKAPTTRSASEPSDVGVAAVALFERHAEQGTNAPSDALAASRASAAAAVPLILGVFDAMAASLRAALADHAERATDVIERGSSFPPLGVARETSTWDDGRRECGT